MLKREVGCLNISAEEIWLNYFNEILWKNGIIDEKKKNRMNNLIFKYLHQKHF